MSNSNDLVVDLFNRAIELPFEERAEFVATQCKCDDSLRQELTRLLSHYDAQPQDYSQYVIQAELETCHIGDVVGPYEVVSKLGHGGMADVFLANRKDGVYEGKVALKVIRTNTENKTLLRRFEQERQLQYSLNHPNIAKLLDGGSTDDGLPYYVMDYIDGTNLTQFCEDKKLNIRERLRLFQKVCGAVAFAHQRLIIHRDIKPSNILVDNQSEPKLLDFGIASLLGLEELNQAQKNGPLPMTPKYASPEQVLGQPLTTTSDVYSLGVLLYELLTGKSPYPFSSPQEIVNNISKFTPPKLSTAIEPSSNKKRRELSGDLESIVAKAMNKEASLRYQSVNAFSEDIDYYLQNRAVQARNGAWLYRTIKFLRRNKKLVLISCVSTIIAVSIGLTQQVRVLEERDIATVERDRLTKTREFLIGLFNNSNPAIMQGENFTVREILNKGVFEIRETLADQPDIKSELLVTLGVIHHELGLYSESVSLLQEAVNLRRNSPTLSQSDLAYGLIELGKSLEALDKIDDARNHYLEAKNIFLNVVGDDHKGIAFADQNMGRLLFNQGDYPSSITYLESALSTFTLSDANSVQTATTLNFLGNVYYAQRKLDIAKNYYAQALDILKEESQDFHPLVADIHNNVGSIHLANNDLEKAKIEYEKSISIKAKTLGQQHLSISKTYSNMGLAYFHSGNYAEAITSLDAALSINRRALGNSHISSASILNTLGLVYLDLGQYQSARPLFEEALSIQKESYGQSHPELAQSYVNLGNLFIYNENPKLAITNYEKALQIFEEYFKGEHQDIALALNNLGYANIQLNNFDRGLEYYNQAYAMNLKLFGPEHSTFALDFSNLGEAYFSSGQHKKAVEYSEMSIERYLNSDTPDHPYLAYPYSTLGDVYSETKQVDLALDNYQKAYAIRLTKLGPDHPLTLGTNDRIKELLDQVE